MQNLIKHALIWGHVPTEEILRTYPSEVKSGVNLDQKSLD